MTASEALLIGHILLVVYWLGTDVGVFYGSFVMRRRGLSTETRRTVRRMMRNLDLAPRLALILMIPSALGLARAAGYAFTGASWAPAALWALAAVAVGWAAASVWAFRHALEGRTDLPGVRAFVRFDWAARGAAAAYFVGTGVSSLIGDAPYRATWVAWKALLFGVVIVLGLAIRVAARRYLPALTVLLDDGEGGGRLEALNRSIRSVYPPVVAVWVLVVAIVVVAVVRP